jgi:hypothetical protein
MNMKPAVRTFTVSILSVVAAVAEETPATPGYELKNRSTFTAAEDARAPFWPIGFAKRAKVAQTAAVAAPVVQKVTLDPSQFKITSILLGSPSLAVINGRAYGEGEYLKAAKAAATPGATPVAAPAPAPARIRLQQITDGSVVLQCGEQSLTVPFHRPGLAAKTSRELSLEDR